MKQKIVLDDNWKFHLGDLPPKTSADSWGGAKTHGYLNSVVSPEYDDYYKSWWTDEDVLHIFFDGKRVYCYSNFDEIELFANGKSCGRKEMLKNWYLKWENIEDGVLTANSYKNGTLVMKKTLDVVGKPCKIRIETCNKIVKKMML